MYLPQLYRMDDRNEVLAFMKAYSFAAVITAKDNLPTVTHIPVVVTEENGALVLTGHFSKANTQWQEMENEKVLVVFSEPHAYISPSHYDTELSVPTWNYIAVHAYGKGEIVTDNEAVAQALKEMINTYEKAYETQWNGLPETFKTKMMNGIVCFKITVTSLQAKKKLSQNKNEHERERIILALEHGRNEPERTMALYMKQNEATLK